MLLLFAGQKCLMLFYVLLYAFVFFKILNKVSFDVIIYRFN